MDVGLAAAMMGSVASSARPGDPNISIDWGMVGGLAGVTSTALAGVGIMAAVAIARWQHRQTMRREQQAESAHARAPRTAFNQPELASIMLDPAAPTVRAPVAGASLTAPLGLLPATVRGRDGLLRRIRDRLQEGGLVVLAGAGGVGKSTVARELIRRVQAEDTSGELQTWWLSAASRSTLAAGLVSVARELGATDPDLRAISDQTPDGPDRLWRLLEQAERRWLLVIDNADDIEMLAAPAVPAAAGEREAIPAMAEGTGWARAGGQGLVLLTSRLRSPVRWGAAADLEPVDVLDEQESARVLLDLAPAAGDQGQAEALGRRLGGLPLALHLAGSYLTSEFAGWRSFAAYGQALDREPASVVSAGHEPLVDERGTLMGTWELSLDALDRQGVGQARALLRLLSCYAPALPIPLDLLDAGRLGDLLGPAEGQAGEPPAMRLEVGLRGLSSLGLIEASSLPGDATAIVVHPVIAASNRVYLVHPRPPDPDPFLVRRVAVALLTRSVEALGVDRPAEWPRWELLVPHVQALLEYAADRLDEEDLAGLIHATDRTALAHHWMGAQLPAGWGLPSQPMGAQVTAEALARAALATGGRLGEDHPALLAVRMRCAYQAGRRGRWGEAEEAYREVLEAERRVLGDDHPDTLTTRHELAWAVALQLGRWKEAEAAYREVLEARRRVLGDDHPDTLATRHALALVVADQGRWGEAEGAFRKVLEARRRVLGDDHPHTLATRLELARMVAGQGRWKEAEAAYREVLEAERRVLGDDHPDTLATRQLLASVVTEEGRWEEAEAAFRELLEAERRVLGDDNPNTLATRWALAWVAAEQGRWGVAEAAFRELLEAERRVLGDDHLNTLTDRAELARVVAEQGGAGERQRRPGAGSWRQNARWWATTTTSSPWPPATSWPGWWPVKGDGKRQRQPTARSWRPGGGCWATTTPTL